VLRRNLLFNFSRVVSCNDCRGTRFLANLPQRLGPRDSTNQTSRQPAAKGDRVTKFSRRAATFGLLASALPIGNAHASYTATRNDTAFMVAGRDKTIEIARQIDRVDTPLVSNSGDISMTEEMRKVFVAACPP
jgi:hypothetical protein